MDDQQRVDKHNKSRELELLTMRQLIKTENGRAFMYRCLQNCCTFESIYNKDTHEHAFNAGARSHGLWLDEELREADKDSYLLMLKENR